MAQKIASIEVFCGDSISLLEDIADNSINAVITDPPYNVSMAGWDSFETNAEYGDWCHSWAAQCFRILKPGGAFMSFSAARTYHWLAVGAEKSGLETRDMIEWIYWASFAKGKNLKPGHEPIYYGVKQPLSDITFNLDDCRIPMNRKQQNALEAAVLANQPTKPRADIWSKPNDNVGKKYNSVVGKKENGWKHTTNPPHPGGRVPYNVITDYSLDMATNFVDFKKPRGKDSIPDHPTQKPVVLMEWLIKLVTNPGDIILDPFAGTGTTGVAARNLGRHSILFDREQQYVDLIEKRIEAS